MCHTSGRANHRLDEPSRAVLVPANRFEVLECQVAIEAVAEGAQETPPLRTGAFDVLARHVPGSACSEPFHPDALYAAMLARIRGHVVHRALGRVSPLAVPVMLR